MECPFALLLPRVTTKDKRIPININWYRNSDYREKNAVKKLYLEHMRKQLEGVVLQTPVEVEYTVYKPTMRILDKMNVVSVTSKFLLDAMTELGVWPDDNDDYVKTETIHPTQLDRKNERVVVTFRSIKENK